MKIYVYTLAHDTGFAPNPFHGYCTLACCKPQIRKRAVKGDWVLGITPKGLGHKLAYYMLVDEVLPFATYFEDARFFPKQPPWPDAGRPVLEKCGDNIYQPLGPGRFRQLPSMHSDGAQEDRGQKEHDLSGEQVLIAKTFGYFGRDAVDLDPSLGFMVPGRYLRCRFSETEVNKILAFVTRQPRGRRGPPRDWPEDDTTWKQRARCG